MAWKCTSIIPPDHLFWIWHLHFLQDLEKAASQLSVSVLRAERNSRLVKPCNLCPLPMSEHPYRCHYWLPNQFRQHYWTWMCQRYLATRCEYYFILFQYCFSYLAQYFLRRRDEYSIYNPGPQWRMMYCNSLKKKWSTLLVVLQKTLVPSSKEMSAKLLGHPLVKALKPVERTWIF